MSEIVVGIAGAIGSGKTELAHGLAAELDGFFASFGDFVRQQAKIRGLDAERNTLQALGERLIADLGWEEFVRVVTSGWNRKGTLIVDGVRHVHAVTALRRLASPGRFVLLFVRADEDVRRLRLSEVRPADARECKEVKQHSTEREVETDLRGIADVLVNGHAKPEDVLRETLAALRRLEDAWSGSTPDRG